MTMHHALIGRLYQAYNDRDLTTLSSGLCEDVDWPDGDRRLHGRATVEDYWLRQWSRFRTCDTVVDLRDLDLDRTVVRIRQVVRDLDGATLSEGAFEHTFSFRDGLVARLDISRTDQGKGNSEMADDETMVRRLYDGFNRRDIPAVLAMLDEEVAWANGMDGGHEHGREAVRAYWTRQWAVIQPRVDPLRIARREDGATVVEVHQVVRDLEGALLLDETVRHVFRFDGGLVTRFDIENAGGLSAIAHG